MQESKAPNVAETKPMSGVEEVRLSWFDWYMIMLSPYGAAIWIILYALNLNDWVAYVLVPLGMVHIVTIPIYVWRRSTWMRVVLGYIRWVLSQAWILSILGLTKIHNLWMGKFLTTLLVGNLVVFPAM